ncbi:MAG: 3-dehydroquinate synthase [Chlamydiales bacterium]|jgi:3-dehydroquinate synthase
MTEIEIGQGILETPKFAQRCRSLGSISVIITDSNVEGLYGQRLLEYLRSQGLEVQLLAFPAGETHKSRRTKENLEDQMLASGLGRDTCVIGLGGGVVTDLAGFLASTYCRGVPLILAPTTLLGMVDASIGGKTAVNVPHGKNLIGSFYEAKHLVIDTLTLETLSKREFLSGMAEVIKHGLIADADYFSFLEENVDAILKGQPDIINKIIHESVRLKNHVANADSKERGIRRILNFGHTIGHAIELLDNYQTSHGEAVVLGCIIEGEISRKLGYLSLEDYERLQEIFQKFGMYPTLKDKYTAAELLKTMQLDKKSVQKTARFVLLEAIGKACEFEGDYCKTVDSDIVTAAFQPFAKQCHNLLCSNQGD